MADPFSLPLEWIPDEDRLIVDAIRTWADTQVIPVRRQIDEDWDRHEFCRTLLEALCVEHGYQWAAWREHRRDRRAPHRHHGKAAR